MTPFTRDEPWWDEEPWPEVETDDLDGTKAIGLALLMILAFLAVGILLAVMFA